MNLTRMFKNLDYTLLLTVTGLILFSLIVIGSATLEFDGESFNTLRKLNFFAKLIHLDYTYVIKQLTWILIGFVLMFLMIYIPYEDILKHARFLYILNLVLLISVLITGHAAYGAQRWICLGPFIFQPSEFSKLFVIITFTSFLVKRQGKLESFYGLIPCIIYIGFPMLLILMQPDLGTSMVFIAIMFPMLFFAGAKPSLLLKILGAVMALVIILISVHLYLHNNDLRLEKQLQNLRDEKLKINAIDPVKTQELEKRCEILTNKYQVIHNYHEKFHKYTLKEYQMTRLFIFLNPESDLLGDGYHIWQSLISIGSGGFLGKGLLGGTQSHLTFLPARHTDFIFSVVGEEFGFIGTLFLLSLFFVIVYRGVRIALEARDLPGTILSVGVVCMFTFHVFVNIGMTSGIMPVTGIPLPLFSYGGSNIIMNMMSLGLLLNVYVRRRKILF